MSRWYRAYVGTVTDAKLAEAAMIAEVSRSVSIATWHTLLEGAADRNNCGSFDATPRRVAVILCEPVERIEALFAAYRELGLIADDAVSSWSKRQYQSDDSKDRVAKHRAEKRRKTATKEDGNADVTACNGDVTAPDTESDTDKESSNEDLSAGPTDKPLTKQEVIDAWRQRMVPQGFPDIRKMTGQRERMLSARLKDCTVDEWQSAMDALERSSFCKGQNDRGWWADFDFLLQPKSFTKLIEGAYDH